MLKTVVASPGLHLHPFVYWQYDAILNMKYVLCVCVVGLHSCIHPARYVQLKSIHCSVRFAGRRASDQLSSVDGGM